MVIRAQQLTAFESSARHGFENGLAAHIEEYFPVHWREAGEKHICEVIRLGMTNGANYGLETKRDIYVYVGLMLYLGSYFDTDPQLPWAAAGLNDKSQPDPFLRVDATYDSATAYLDRVAGPDGEFSVAAVDRFTKVTEDLTRSSSVALSEILKWMYPEKFNELSDEQFQKVAQLSYENAQAHALEIRQGVVLFAALASLLGHRFVDDPQFFWAAEVLNNPKLMDPLQRVTALKEASVLRLRRWLSAKATAK